MAGSPRKVKSADASVVRWGGKSLDSGDRGSRGGEEVEHLFEHPAPRDGEPLRGDRPGGVAVAQRECLLEPVLDARGKRTVGMIGSEQPTPAQQMRETRLMVGLAETPIRSPAIAREDAGEVRAEDGHRVGKSAPGANGIDRGVARGEGPQPVQRPGYLPPCLVRTHLRTPAHVPTQRVIGRGRSRGHTRTHMDERASGDPQPEVIAEQRHDVRQRQAHPLVQDHHECGGLGADLHRGGAEGLRRLQRMAALHAPAAGRTRPHVDAKLAHDGTHDRQIFLILGDDSRALHVAPTRRTGRGQWRVVRLIDARGHRTRAVAAVRRTRAPAWRTACALSVRFGEWRRLPEARPTGRLELTFEPLVPTLQSIALVFRPRQCVAQARDLVLLLFDQRVAIVGRWRALSGHALVMPERRYL